MIIIEGVVCANGIPDSDSDVLDKSDIKRLFVDYHQNSVDINHNFIQNTHDDVEVISSYICDSDKVICGEVAPAGSWLATMKVKNPGLIKAIKNGDLNGFSLASIPKSEIEFGAGIVKSSDERGTYSKFLTMDSLTPKFISIVGGPANGYGLDIMTREQFVLKSKTAMMDDLSSLGESGALDEEVRTLKNENVKEEKDLSMLEKVLDAINAVLKYEKVDDDFVKMEDGTLVHESMAEQYVENHPDSDGEEPKKAGKADADKPKKGKKAEVKKPKKGKKSVKKAEDETSKACGDKDDDLVKEEDVTVEDVVSEETIPKFDIDAIKAEIKEDIIRELREQIKESEAAKVEDLVCEEVDEEIVEEIVEDARAVSEKPEDMQEVASEDDFYAMTGRDPITGRKL